MRKFPSLCIYELCKTCTHTNALCGKLKIKETSAINLKIGVFAYRGFVPQCIYTRVQTFALQQQISVCNK